MKSYNKSEPELFLETWGNAEIFHPCPLIHLSAHSSVNPLFIWVLSSAHLLCGSPWARSWFAGSKTDRSLCTGERKSVEALSIKCVTQIGQTHGNSRKASGDLTSSGGVVGWFRDFRRRPEADVHPKENAKDLLSAAIMLCRKTTPISVAMATSIYFHTPGAAVVDCRLTNRSWAWLGGFGLGSGLGSGLLYICSFWSPGWRVSAPRAGSSLAPTTIQALSCHMQTTGYLPELKFPSAQAVEWRFFKASSLHPPEPYRGVLPLELPGQKSRRNGSRA